MREKLKRWMLPIAMLSGVLFYKWIDEFTFLSPYLIFMMLTITYCRIEPHDFKIGRFQAILLSVQMILAAVVYFSISWIDETVASGVFICVFIPTATAAPVITGLLGGSITRVATYSFACNICVALIGPIVLAAMSGNEAMTFFESFNLICSRVLPLLILPILTALILRYTFRKLHDKIASHQKLSFYLWAIALCLVVGSSVSFIIKNFSPDKTWIMIFMALGALVVCVTQFLLGRKVGRHFGDVVAGGQGLGQKNTVLAIWLSLAYLNPLSSVAPAAYIAWQNIINSWQLMKKQKQL